MLELPLTVLCDVEVEGTELVRLDMDLPTLDEFPKVTGDTNVLGQPVFRRSTQRERWDRCWSICLSLCLLLAHETFRALPTLEGVEIVGRRCDALGANGEAAPVLWLRVGRETLAQAAADLDREHCSAFLALGGVIGCTLDAVLVSLSDAACRRGRLSVIGTYTPTAPPEAA